MNVRPRCNTFESNLGCGAKVRGRLCADELTTVWLLGEHDFPAVEINQHQAIDPAELPVSDAAFALLIAWLKVAEFRSQCAPDEMLTAGVRAASAVARELPSNVRVNFAMRLPDGPGDQTLGRWVSVDIDRID
ncbi:hypothetical protein BH10ACT8_BH10ACT8_09610 [soil metagenome]